VHRESGVKSFRLVLPDWTPISPRDTVSGDANRKTTTRKIGMAFRIEFSRRARDNLKGLRKRDQQIIIDAIVVQRAHRPDQPTRQRKKLEDNELAPWELRVGGFRVFYDLAPDEELVIVLAVGHKTHNVLRIGEEEIDL
jgi:mRNA-degrading endonuclease RelE of RelBE toxin-antitoxin system